MSATEPRRGYLAPWYDPELVVPEGLTAATLRDGELRRIYDALLTILYAASLPRRLGGSASDEELASDKKRCRRVAHALKQAYFGWDKKGAKIPADVPDEVRQAGAQLLWTEFGQLHLAKLGSTEVLIATWATRNGEHTFGKKALTLLENERNWITYALRD